VFTFTGPGDGVTHPAGGLIISEEGSSLDVGTGTNRLSITEEGVQVYYRGKNPKVVESWSMPAGSL
jgi:hypothetical protein